MERVNSSRDQAKFMIVKIDCNVDPAHCKGFSEACTHQFINGRKNGSSLHIEIVISFPALFIIGPIFQYGADVLN